MVYTALKNCVDGLKVIYIYIVPFGLQINF